jgi:PAS domain S-box-containing protein
MSDLSQNLLPAAADTDTETWVGELLDAVAVPAWLHRAGAPLRGNPALQRLCGLTPEALLHTPHLTMVVDDDREALARATDECLLGSGEPSAQSAQLLTANGSTRPVELTLRRVHPGGVPAALITCIDLSDFQHVQAMLLATSGLLRQIVDGAPVASFVIDANHRVTHWNTACERLTGLNDFDMVGSTEAWRAFYPAERPLLADAIVDGLDPMAQMDLHGDVAKPSSLVQGAYEQESFFASLGSDGRWLHFTAVPLRDHTRQVTGAIVTLQDVSQRRRTEEELHRRLERMVEERSAELAASARVMDALIDNAPIGVVQVAGEQVLRHNQRVVEIFGLASEAADPQRGVSGRDFFYDRDDAAALRAVAGPLLARGEPVHHEMWLHHASGRPVWTQVNAFVINRDDTKAGTWWMLQDRTEMRAAQAALNDRYEQLQATHRQLEQTQNQLLQSDKMASIGQLAAGVAHEINNPVGFVSSNLHTLRQYVQQLLDVVDAYGGALPPGSPAAAAVDGEPAAVLQRALQSAEIDYLKEDLPQLLDESADGLARVKKIVQDLKDFSRVDQADWQQADLNAGLESTLNVVRHEVKYKADVVKNLGTLPLVLCLAGQLNQVFLNMIVNASQSIADHGTITLSTGTAGPVNSWVWVQVTDTGVGMTDEVQRRIFEPFYTTKDVGKGTGLGLSLSFSIIKRHGGEIQVRSVVGQGTSFRVWVPVAGPVAGGGVQPAPPAWE